MRNLPRVGIFVVLILSQCAVFRVKNRHNRETKESDKSANDTEQQNVLNIRKELVTHHIEARRKHDRRQDCIKEQVVIKFHDHGEFPVSLDQELVS